MVEERERLLVGFGHKEDLDLDLELSPSRLGDVERESIYISCWLWICIV